MRPSDLLVAAADRIRDLAAAATPGEWSIKANEDRKGNHVHSTFTLPPLPGSNMPRDRMVRPSEAADYAWIAALSPAVAPGIFGLLTTAAAHEGLCGTCGFCAAALSIAHVLCPELVEEDQK